MLLKIISIICLSSLVACAPGIPEYPNVSKCLFLKKDSGEYSFYCVKMKDTNVSFELTLDQAEKLGMIATTAQDEREVVKYVEDLKALAKQRCK